MMFSHSIIAVFDTHDEADAAVRALAKSGFALRRLSIVGKGFHTDEMATGFYNSGDRLRFWGSRAALWGGLWGLFMGGLFATLPVVGMAHGTSGEMDRARATLVPLGARRIDVHHDDNHLTPLPDLADQAQVAVPA